MLVLLEADVGGGKTSFVKGVMNDRVGGLVSSPSFTIMNEYEKDGMKVRHIDLYRLDDVDMIIRSLKEYHDESDGVSFVEWPSVSIESFQDWDLRIIFSYGADESQRDILIEAGDSDLGRNIVKSLRGSR